jgi:hypothetical protein
MKLFRLMLMMVTLFAGHAAASQIGIYTFTGAAGTEATLPVDAQPANANFSVMNRGSGVTGTAGANTFASTGWATGPLDLNDYVQFSITPDAGFSVTLTNLAFSERRSNTGIRDISIASSLDNFATSIADFTVPDNDQTRNQTVPLGSGFANLTGVTFRLYGYNAEAGTGTWRVDNVALFGAINSAGPPPTNVLFTASSASIGEAGGSYTVTVYKTLASGNVSGTVALSGTAANPADYTINTTNFTMNGATTSATLVVTISDDGDTESAETVILTIDSVSGGTIASPSVFTLTITDNDAGPPPSGLPWINEIDYDSVGSDSNEWVEIIGPAGLSLDDYELVMISDAGVTYNTFDLAGAAWTFTDENNGYGFFVIGNVASGEGTPDYTPAAWTADEMQNGPADSIQLRLKAGAVNVHLVDYEGDNANTTDDQNTTASDDNVTALKSIFLTGGPGSGFAAFTWTNTAGVASPGAINNDQTLGAATVTTNVRFSASSASVSESSVSYTVTVFKTVADGNVTAEIALSGTATEGGGNDYTTSTTNLTLNGATTSATVVITINDDIEIEATETIILTLTNVVGGTVASPFIFTLSITDNDNAPLNPPGTNVMVYQRFEVGDLWTITDGASLVSTNMGEADSPELQRIQQGVQSWQVNNASVTLALENVAIDGFTNRAIKARISSTSNTSGNNGADSGDRVRFYVSIDGEAFDTGTNSDVSLTGNLNARWGYWATGVVDVIAGTTNSFTPLAGALSTNNISTVLIRLPDTATSVALRVWALNDSTNEIWNLDNIEILGEIGDPPAGVPPVLSAIGNKTTRTNTAISFAVSAVATDGDPVTLTVSNAPGGSTFGTTNIAGTFTWVSPSPAGVYTMTFYAADNDGSDSETITITVTNTPAPVTGGMNLGLWFNELHYDTIGGDVNEGFEIAGPSGVDLSSYSVLLYDSGGLGVYSTVPLSGVIPNQSNGMGTLWFNIADGVLQNGPADGLALVYNSTGLVQFISYEGSFIPVVGPASGVSAINIGSLNAVSLTTTLQLCGTGTNYTEMATTGGWITNSVDSRGAFNTCQVIPGGPPSTDDDGDLIPNDWETLYFGTSTGAIAGVDTDLDGFINIDEYIAGTNPTNGLSYFEFNNITPSGVARSLEFETVTGRVYQVLWTTSLFNQVWLNSTNGIIGSGSPVSVTDTNEGDRFFQIRTRLNLP